MVKRYSSHFIMLLLTSKYSSSVHRVEPFGGIFRAVRESFMARIESRFFVSYYFKSIRMFSMENEIEGISDSYKKPIK